jgi:hypothetical protein
VDREGRGSVPRSTAVALDCAMSVEDWLVEAVRNGHLTDAGTIGNGRRLIAVLMVANEDADNKTAAAMHMLRAASDMRNTAKYLAAIGIDVVCRSRTGRVYVRQRARCVNRPDGPDPLEAA